MQKDADRYFFVEVKERTRSDDAAWAIGSHQQARIIRAAGHRLAVRGIQDDFDLSFDVILVAPWSLPRHIGSAFRA